MADPYGPTTPPPDLPGRPPAMPPASTPPAKAGPPWGKIALFGCLGLFVLGLLVAIAGYFIYQRTKREQDDLLGEYTRERQGTQGGGVVPGGSQQLSGTLGPSDPTRDDGSYYEEWTFDGVAGSRVVVTMKSSDFDAFITVFAPSGATHSDDDSGGGTDSRLELTLNEGGTWRVWANTLRPGATGDYTLEIAR